MAATGVLLALLERHRSGLGQVVETDMVYKINPMLL
jgi:crotonobetainyl-CoA:carnitine CoA-transferase CaiB-like acyl-CoA transferase